MKYITAFLIFALAQLAALGQTRGLFVPGNLENQFGNGGSGPPLHLLSGASVRYQQVYSATEFARAGVDALLIIGLYFRPDQSGHSFTATLPDIQFNLSTTTSNPDGLSTIFSENLGLDDTVVYERGSLALHSSGPFFTDIIVPLTTPFLYRPSQGNLLLDIRNFAGGETTFIDGAVVVGDSLSSIRAYTGDGTGSAGSLSGTASTYGIVTLFEYVPVPEPQTWLLLLLAMGLGCCFAWRQRKEPNSCR